MSSGFFFLSITLAILFAVMIPTAAQGQTESVTVTVYNQNRALINEIRTLTIPKGRQVVEFRDVAETIDPTSLQVRSLNSPKEFTLLDQNYEYDLITIKNLLNKYVSKRLKVILPDPSGAQGAKITRDAILLANNDKPVFRMEGGSNEVYVGDCDAVLLPEIPEGLRPQPTLVWLVDNGGAEEQRVEVSYLAGSMNWKADYVLKVDRDNARGSLSGWVTLDNQSGKAFKDARLKLVAGEVHQVTPPPQVDRSAFRAMTAEAPQEGMAEEALFEYHLYSLGRLVDLANRQIKQVSLLQSPLLSLEKRFVGRWNTSLYDGKDRSIQKQKLSVLIKFRNTEENGLGIPLPKGILRAYQQSSDETVIFIGEDQIDHTGKDVDVEVKMGEAFDVIVERRMTDYRKTGTNTVRFGWELKLKNSKDTPQTVEIEETLPGEWRLIESNTKYEKLDARRVRFTTEAQPTSKNKDTVVTYQAEVTW